MNLLRVASLSASLGGREVLRDIGFAVSRGELIGLIGPNGAGKSALLKATLGLIPSRGSVFIDGRDLRELTVVERARRVAYLPQEREVAWPLKARDIVALGRIPHLAPFTQLGPADHDAIARAMHLADIASLAERPVSAMSGGERARVLIARALAQDAPLLLVDEPVAGLDPAHQIALMELLAGIAAEGRSVIVTLHELHLAARWCHRLLLLNGGRLVADGAAAQVLTHERLADVYGVKAYLAASEGRPVIVPVERLARPS